MTVPLNWWPNFNPESASCMFREPVAILSPLLCTPEDVAQGPRRQLSEWQEQRDRETMRQLETLEEEREWRERG